MKRNLVLLLSAAVVAAGLVLFVSSPASAEDASTLQGEEVCIPPDVQKRVLDCPEGIKMGSKRRGAAVGTTTVKKEKPKPKGPAGPSLGRDYTRQIIESAFKRKREKKKIDILKKEIQLIKRLAAATANDNPEKAEILKRLADAYKEFYDQLNYMARDLEEKIFQAKQKGKKKQAAKLRAQQKALDKKADEYRELSIKAYVEIRNNFPDYPDYDEILFAIAYEIDQMAQAIENKKKKASYRERARVFYQELIRNYPRSRFIPHAWMAFGEYYFHEALDVDRAMASYEKVVEWGEEGNPNYVIAMYYQAWCLFNMQEYKKTINQFNKVIQFAEANPEHREAQAVAKRSRMELVDPFSKIGNPSQSWEFFQRVGGELAHKMLVKLAELYYADGHWADAIIVYHKLQALELENHQGNNADDLCYYQTQVTNAVISSRPKDEQLVELRRQLSLYKKFSTEQHDAVKIKQCASSTTALAWDQATQWHIEAVGSESSPGTKDANTMELTIGLYDTILETFPDLDNIDVEGYDEKTRPTNYRVAYYKAELFWNMEDWARCAPAFDAVVDMDPGGEYTADAAYAAVLCYNKVYIKERGEADRSRKHKLKADVDGKKKCDKKCKKCKKACKGKDKKECWKKCEEPERIVLKPRDLTDLETGILKSYDRYICHVQKGEDLLTIKYRRARIYYEANHFAEAAVLFKDIAINHSDDELAVFAANLYLDCINVLGSMVETPIPACYDDLAQIVDIFIDTTKKPGINLMKDEEFAAQIKALKVGVLRKKAESLTSRKRFKESAEIYLLIYREYREVYDERGMCEVLFNTAINMEAARLMYPAIKVREKMIELYPDCEHSKKAAYYIGANYHALQYFPLAAANYEKFAKKYSGEEEAPEALSNAITFYIGLGKIDEAWKAVKLFEQKYRTRQPEMTADVVFGAGFILVEEAEGADDDKAWDAVRKHYTRYLKTYSKVKKLHQQAQAHVLIADSYWYKRKSDKAKASKSYKKAAGMYDEGKALEKIPNGKDKAQFLIAVAKSRYQVAELKFQEFKKIKFPDFKVAKEPSKAMMKWYKEDLIKRTGADAWEKREKWHKDRRRLARWGYWDESKPRSEQIKDVKKEEKNEEATIQFQYWLEHKFAPWMEKKSKVLTEATDMFAEVTKLAVTVPEWEMAAAARAGDMQLEFMQSLYDAPVPPSFEEDEELLGIYRQSMDEKAQPFRDGAVGGYKHCLEVSTKLRWFNENSLRCESELNKLDPRTYPVSEEIRIQPNNRVERWAIPEPILELETVSQKRERELKTSAAEITGEK